jgi:site-specific DNA-methyltransferase (adenine-specific)
MNYYKVGDNMESLEGIEDESIDLVYLDPPYNTGRDFGDFVDKFDSMESFREDFLRPRIKECHRIIKKTGNIVVHVDPTISHHVRIILDDIFGYKKFTNEVAWVTGGNAKNKKKMNRFHDTIIFYKKSNKSIFRPMYLPYDDEYKKKSNVKMCEIHKKEYVTTAIHNSQPDVNPRMNLRYEWNGHKKQWYVRQERMKELHDDNRLQYNSKGVPRIKRFLKEMDGIPIRDVWNDICNTQSGEKLDYATQKPVKLLERILSMLTEECDLVLDPFAGSGTTGRAAINLNRNYILFDISEKGRNEFLKSINKK